MDRAGAVSIVAQPAADPDLRVVCLLLVLALALLPACTLTQAGPQAPTLERVETDLRFAVDRLLDRPGACT
ncbi:MAG: hypothetical protein HY331_17640 [Chloroflexi bacterium]|nr:hypothetical protein [Chloroflexota bacterium]